MTVWGSSNLTGGALGAAVTTATEPIFSAKGGTVVYGPQVGSVPGASMEIGGATVGDMTIDLGARTHARVAFWLQWASGARTATNYIASYVDGATNRGNVVFHNTTSPGFPLLRNNTTVQATGTTAMAIADIWYVEVEYEAGVGYKLHLWYPGNLTNTPNQVLSYASALTATGIRIGNIGSVAGMVMRYAGVRASDGEQIRNIPAGTVKGQLLDVDARVPTGTLHGRLLDVSADVPAPTLHGRLLDVQATVPSAFIVSISDPGVLEPGIPVEVTATATGGTPITYNWVCAGAEFQADGDSIVMTPTPTWDGDAVTVGCTVAGTGAAIGGGARTIPVLPHLEWVAVGGTWKPRITELLTL